MSDISEYFSKIRKAADIIRHSHFAVAFTGAGLSTRSGIPDFRSPDTGLWAQTDLSQSGEVSAGSIRGFARDPQAFYNGFGPLVKKIFDAEPNPAHLALAEMETRGYINAIITQNADLLHQRAGSQQVIEVHGSLAEATCIKCYKVVLARPLFEKFFIDGQVPCCQECVGVMKPNVILTGEQIPAQPIITARQAIRQCDALLIAGTSLPGGPATALVESAHEQNVVLIIVNRTPTLFDSCAHVVIHADVVEALPALADIL